MRGIERGGIGGGGWVIGSYTGGREFIDCVLSACLRVCLRV